MSRRKAGGGVPQGPVLVPPPFGSSSVSEVSVGGLQVSVASEIVMMGGRRKDEERQSHPETEAAGAEDSPPVDQDYRHVASGRQHPRLHTGGGRT